MKKFMYNVASFVGIFLVLLAGVFFVRSSYHKPHKLLDDTRILLLGDSHVQYSIDDSRLANTQNVAIISEGYIYTYYKLKEILFANPQLTTVILGFSYHNISSYYDDSVLGKRGLFAQRYIMILDLSGINELFTQRPGFISPFIRGIVHSLPYIGGFTSIDNHFSLAAMNKRIKFQYFEGKKVRAFSYLNIKYLKKIVKLCEQRDVKLVLLQTPMYDRYIEKIPHSYIIEYQQVLKDSNLRVIEFPQLSSQKRYFLPDGDHVNANGAQITTTEFIKEMSHEYKNK